MHVARNGCMTDGLLGPPPAPTSWGQFYARGKVWFDFVSLFGHVAIFLTTLILLLWCNNGGRLLGWVVGLSGNEEMAVYVLLLPLSSGPALTITFEVYGQIPLIAPESETQRKAWLSFVILGSVVTIGIGFSDVLWTYQYFDALNNNPLTLIVLFSFFFLLMLLVELAAMFELLPKSEKGKERERKRREREGTK
uniref:Uncharacterized protein n=1 Tax=Paramoeba aestuarina TaxID=180227 RepID=A0A7S4PER1_9EUKA|mmetsp:Transcript_5072/g.7578  ORF Transcript_5072/g.7578 Transcript_5072/m.7578 type:complete len:194 (+) Transcript_5072:178-759(+)